MDMASPHRARLSVVIAIISDVAYVRGDMSHLVGCLEALSRQVEPPPMETLVPYYARIHRVKDLVPRFPHVVFVPVEDPETLADQRSRREHIDRLRACGLAAASGEIVALIEDVGRPDAHWCARTVEAHQPERAAVGGAIENGIDRPLNWAVYFCDFLKYQNPVPAGESAYVSDANVAYRRSALESIRPVWQEAFHETEVNWALVSRGERLTLSPAMIVFQHRTDLQLGSVVRERFVWGRYYAARRSMLWSTAKRLAFGLLAPMLPAMMMLRMTATVIRKGRTVGAFLRALPLIVLLTSSWSLAEMVGYLTARTASSNPSQTGTFTCSRSIGPDANRC